MKINNSIEGARLPSTNDAGMLQFLATKGIYLNPNEPAYFNSKSTINGMAMDADTWLYNQPSNGVPLEFLVEYSKKPIKQILLKRAYNQIGAEYQMGGFATQTVRIPVQGLVAQVSSYGDYSADPISDANYTWSPRDLYRFQTVIQYGDLEVEAGGMAKLDIIGGKRYSASQAIAITQNKLFFTGDLISTGVFASKTFGILNDPALNPAIALTGGWATATTNSIINDINKLFQQLQTQTGNNVSQDTRLLLCLSGEASAYLSTPNANSSFTVAQVLRETYPNLQIVVAPEYKTLSSGLGGIQMIAIDLIDEKAAVDLFAYKYRSHGTIRQLSSYQEKVSASSGGCGVLAPAAVVTGTGL